MRTGADLEVSGGAGGVGAELDDLDHASSSLRRSAADLRGASADLHLGRSLLRGLDGVLADPGSALELEVELVAVHAELQRVAESTEGLGDLVAACATGYRSADEAVRDRWSALGALVGTVVPAIPVVGSLLTGRASELLHHPQGGSQPAPAGQGAVLGPPSGGPAPGPVCTPGLTGLLPASADPQLGPPTGAGTGAATAATAASGAADTTGTAPSPDLLTLVGRLAGPQEQPFVAMLAGALVGPAALLAPAAPLLSARAVASGAARGIGASTDAVVVARPVPPAVAAAGPPRGVGEVLRRVGVTADAAGPRGRIRVERITHADGSRAAVVYLPGTQDWSTASQVPASADAVLRGVAGDPSAYTGAVLQALHEAGVGPGEPVMLAGHSLGGIVAAQMAADPSVRARADVRAVITAGSPIGHVDIPPDVQTLSLEHGEDLVPHSDGVDNTAVTSNQVTVTSPAPGGLGAHDLQGYAALGDAVDASGDRSLTAFRARTARFFAEPGATSVVTEVVAEVVASGSAP